MKDDTSALKGKNQSDVVVSADLSPRSKILQGKVSKQYSFKVKPLTPKVAVNYFQAAVSKLVDEEVGDSLTDEEWLLMFESTETLRSVSDVQFIDKNYEKCLALWLLLIVEQTFPIRVRYARTQAPELDRMCNTHLLSIKDRKSILGRTSLSDLLVIENRRIKRKLFEPARIGIGYKDKGSLTNTAEDGSPKWQEVASNWLEDLEVRGADSIWRNSATGEVFEWSIKGIADQAKDVMVSSTTTKSSGDIVKD